MENFYNYFLQSSGVCTDTRNISKDCFFVALKGATFNGNTFAQTAIDNGAKYAVVDEEAYANEAQNIFLVDNCLRFLQQLANYHRKQFSIPVIGITGSNGKTSTKELLAAVLQKKYNVHFTKGNLNNHIGVPLTLLQLNSSHEIAVIEMGANHFGDIKELCDIAEPNYGIITNIGKAHLEGFKNFEGVLKTKKELYQAVEANNGTLVYNADDEVLYNNLPSNVPTFAYGANNGKVVGKLERLSPFVELSWSMDTYQSGTIFTNLVGKYNFYNFLAAISFGVLFDVEPAKINEAIGEYNPTNKRSQVVKTTKNTLILDCYNANPTSMRSALESFALIDNPSKFIIIGDMLELGEESKKEHQAIVELVKELNLQGIVVGNEFSNSVLPTTLVNYTKTDDVKALLSQQPITDKLILLKGSRGIGLEVLEEYL
ncbi:MAG TPA: UDP-N-acetylmuramoyl-tripeptide--D-alanyl-D-alanine ligase [Taishania sp.]|nr:UDP-N-acetylmuramoyl-tripeptide--D-alanyl-D-alanine ligase [Taishania sp.]HNS41174.1 UDP-N-acetylmuramoyl-tripeptide--D-alanyl-D-alanine ligase [Taishania sp.]